MSRRLILFGAFDRHNFGDLLLAHCAATAHAEREPVFAGLAARDLRPWGGHEVRSLADVIAQHGHEPADVLHAGGEILTTTAWEAAVMLQEPAVAHRIIARFEHDPAGRAAWAEQVLGRSCALPYVLGHHDLPDDWAISFTGVGGVAFDALCGDARDEAMRALGRAVSLSVRDRVTQAALQRHGVHAALVVDPAARVPELFGDRIALRGGGAECSALRQRASRWLALQVAAEWGDDDSLARIARAAVEVARARRAGIVLFRAVLAPWHDDPRVTLRLGGRIADLAPDLAIERFVSCDVFDLCALLAQADAFLGTSLHGWIVARSFGVPALSLVARPTAKPAAYIDTWGTAVGGAWTTLDELSTRCVQLCAESRA